jgi:hypothetical protein
MLEPECGRAAPRYVLVESEVVAKAIVHQMEPRGVEAVSKPVQI